MKSTTSLLLILVMIPLGMIHAFEKNYPFSGIKDLSLRHNLVFHEVKNPNWLGESKFFYYSSPEKGGLNYFLVDASTGKKRLLNHGKHEIDSLKRIYEKPARKDKQDHTVSPDRKWQAVVRDHNIFIKSLQKGKHDSTQLTYDGTVGNTYEKERIYWSPNSQKIVAMRRFIPIQRKIPLIESAPNNQVQPILHWQAYVKPGDMIESSLPVLLDVKHMRQIPIHTQRYENNFSLFFTGWSRDNTSFTFEYNARGHQNYVVARVNADNGRIRHIIEENPKTFFFYNKRYRYDLKNGREIIWASEVDGWRHLYLIQAQTGKQIVKITTGEWVVREVEYIDEEQRQIYFTASGMNPGEDPYNLHYYRINMDGTGLKELTPEKANHTIVASRDRKYFINYFSRPDLPQVCVLRSMDGSKVTPISKMDISKLKQSGWSMPEVFCAKGRDGKTDIWGTIYRPAHYDPNKSYPIIEDIYAGPHDSHVPKNFNHFNYFIDPLTELGFIVVKIDGMGTYNRSKAFHDVCWKNLKDAGFPDRIPWIKAAAAKYPSMDTTRVGIYGWSAGGQNAMGALLFHHNFYKAAVSFCGCHDNRVDKIWWNEQWMGYPVDASYSQSSNVDNAHLLQGDLLLINGELDRNVDPASTLQVVNALIQANKNFEQLYIPGKGHSLGGDYEIYRMYDFFVRKLRDK